MTLALKMADLQYDAYEEGREEGTRQKALETAKNLLSMGLSPEQVAQGTDLPLEIIHQIQSDL